MLLSQNNSSSPGVVILPVQRVIFHVERPRKTVYPFTVPPSIPRSYEKPEDHVNGSGCHRLNLGLCFLLHGVVPLLPSTTVLPPRFRIKLLRVRLYQLDGRL